MSATYILNYSTTTYFRASSFRDGIKESHMGPWVYNQLLHK